MTYLTYNQICNLYFCTKINTLQLNAIRVVFIVEQIIKAYIFLHDREHYDDSLICINKTREYKKICTEYYLLKVSEGVRILPTWKLLSINMNSYVFHVLAVFNPVCIERNNVDEVFTAFF